MSRSRSSEKDGEQDVRAHCSNGGRRLGLKTDGSSLLLLKGEQDGVGLFGVVIRAPGLEFAGPEPKNAFQCAFIVPLIYCVTELSKSSRPTRHFAPSNAPSEFGV